jgi:hypothetical protein
MTDFEAYLVSKMRAKDLVAKTLAKEGVSRRDLEIKASQAARRWGLDKLGCDARNYAEAIGHPPVAEQILLSTESASVFAGSIRRMYRLELWPGVLFCINQHPMGYVWSKGFDQAEPSARILDPVQVRPWEWASQPIASQASHVEMIDYCEHQQDLRVVFSEGDLTRSYIARFDFTLLQEWSEEQSERVDRPLRKLFAL